MWAGPHYIVIKMFTSFSCCTGEANPFLGHLQQFKLFCFLFSFPASPFNQCSPWATWSKNSLLTLSASTRACLVVEKMMRKKKRKGRSRSQKAGLLRRREGCPSLRSSKSSHWGGVLRRQRCRKRVALNHGDCKFHCIFAQMHIWIFTEPLFSPPCIGCDISRNW